MFGNEILRDALNRITKWNTELPPSGRYWEDGSPMSYGAAFGSNGERDYFRKLAITALNAAQHRMHLTASGVVLLAFLAGFGICWLVFVR